jgi:hypothetical protein
MNEYRDIYKSLFRFCHEFTHQMFYEGPQLDVVNMEAYATPQDWPAHDFIGIDEIRVEFLDAHQIDVYSLFVVSTRDDKNLMRMNDIVNQFVSQVIPSRSRIPIYDSESGLVRGHLVVRNGTRVEAPMFTVTQAARPIFVSLTSDQMSGSS